MTTHKLISPGIIKLTCEISSVALSTEHTDWFMLNQLAIDTCNISSKNKTNDEKKKAIEIGCSSFELGLQMHSNSICDGITKILADEWCEAQDAVYTQYALRFKYVEHV